MMSVAGVSSSSSSSSVNAVGGRGSGGGSQVCGLQSQREEERVGRSTVADNDDDGDERAVGYCRRQGQVWVAEQRKQEQE
jgi:hypothetical protein